jgi:hypothetical protein
MGDAVWKGSFRYSQGEIIWNQFKHWGAMLFKWIDVVTDVLSSLAMLVYLQTLSADCSLANDVFVPTPYPPDREAYLLPMPNYTSFNDYLSWWLAYPSVFEAYGIGGEVASFRKRCEMLQSCSFSPELYTCIANPTFVDPHVTFATCVYVVLGIMALKELTLAIFALHLLMNPTASASTRHLVKRSMFAPLMLVRMSWREYQDQIVLFYHPTPGQIIHEIIFECVGEYAPQLVITLYYVLHITQVGLSRAQLLAISSTFAQLGWLLYRFMRERLMRERQEVVDTLPARSDQSQTQTKIHGQMEMQLPRQPFVPLQDQDMSHVGTDTIN